MRFTARDAGIRRAHADALLSCGRPRSRLHAGPRPEGGSTVRAEFPLNGTAPGGAP
ncbi:hypothetical protein ACIQCF_23620 [Streptomyces sp. NPDC088353]|uniref:hypothetical protein n=1 Tax=unclassified Streptomyces TaxID=2593676 RepID=UPI0036C2566C